MARGLDTLGVTGLADTSATIYAAARNVAPNERIVFGYGEPSNEFFYPPIVGGNFYNGTNVAQQNVWLVLHDKLTPETAYSWVAEIRDLDENVLYSSSVQSFSTLKRGRAMGSPLRGPVFSTGNEFWKLRSSFGHNTLFHTPEALWQACTEYFEWCAENPLYEDSVSSYKGDVTHEPVAKMRAMTVSGLCIFIGMKSRNWYEYAKRPMFADVCELATEIIKTQKFQGAAAGLLNPTLVMRDLGMAEKTELTGADGAPLLDAERFTSSIASLVARTKEVLGT